MEKDSIYIHPWERRGEYIVVQKMTTRGPRIEDPYFTIEVRVNKDSKFAFYNTTESKLIADFGLYADWSECVNDCFAVYHTESKLWGIIDIHGHIMLDFKYKFISIPKEIVESYDPWTGETIKAEKNNDIYFKIFDVDDEIDKYSGKYYDSVKHEVVRSMYEDEDCDKRYKEFLKDFFGFEIEDSELHS